MSRPNSAGQDQGPLEHAGNLGSISSKVRVDTTWRCKYHAVCRKRYQKAGEDEDLRSGVEEHGEQIVALVPKFP